MRTKPCPFCGCADVHVGVASATSREAVCGNYGCRARIVVQYPECSTARSLAELDKRLDAQAVRRWNRREGS